MQQPQRVRFGSRHWLVALGLTVVYLFGAFNHLAEVPLIDPDEPRYATAGRNMFEGGSWLIPEFNGKPRVNKPPLFYWLKAISDALCGEATEVSARLPSIFSGFLMLALAVWMGTHFFSPATGLLAGFILTSSPLFMVISRTCITDQTLSTLLAGALACFLPRVADDQNAPTRKSWLLAGAFLAGLAFLTKGTITVIFFLTPLAYFLLKGRNLFARKEGWSFALPVFLLLALWWYIYLWAALGHDNFRALLNTEILGRLKGDMHQEPFYYYIPVFIVLFAPWGFALPAVLLDALRRVKMTEMTGERENSSARVEKFLAVSVLTLVIFISIPSAKVPTYVLPAFPAAAVLTALFVLRLLSAAGKEFIFGQRPALHLCRLTRALTVLAAVVLLTADALFWVTDNFPEAFSGDKLTWLEKTVSKICREMDFWCFGFGLTAVAFLCVPWFFITHKRVAAPSRRSLLFQRLSVASLALFPPLAAIIVVPAKLDELNNRSEKRLALSIRDRIPADAAVMSLGSKNTCGSLVYYLKRDIEECRRRRPGEADDAVVTEALRSAPPGELFLLLHARYYQKMCGGRLPANTRLIAQSAGFVVLQNLPGNAPDASVLESSALAELHPGIGSVLLTRRPTTRKVAEADVCIFTHGIFTQRASSQRNALRLGATLTEETACAAFSYGFVFAAKDRIAKAAANPAQAQAAADLRRLLDRLRAECPERNIALVAHSEGTLVALLALTNPVESGGPPVNELFLLGSCLAGEEAVEDLRRIPAENCERIYNLFSKRDWVVDWANPLRRSPAAGRNGFSEQALQAAGISEKVVNIDCSALIAHHSRLTQKLWRFGPSWNDQSVMDVISPLLRNRRQ